jgi:hypothetical protein
MTPSGASSPPDTNVLESVSLVRFNYGLQEGSAGKTAVNKQ